MFKYIILGRYAYILVPIAAIMNFLISAGRPAALLRPNKTRASGQSINYRRAAKKKTEGGFRSVPAKSPSAAKRRRPSTWSSDTAQKATAITAFASTTSTTTPF
jgi:hypothetical protein